MKRWVICLTLIFFIGFGLDGMTHKANGQFSKDQEDLESMAGTIWILGYGIGSTGYSMYIQLQMETTPEGFVMLPCVDEYDSVGTVMVKENDNQNDDIIYYLELYNQSQEYTDTYNLTRSGNIIKGTVTTRFDSGEEYADKKVVGFKWDSLICDKNNDDKLGLAEAIHYLKIAAGQ